MSPRSRWGTTAVRIGLAAGGYLACALFVTYPAWLSGPQGVVGDWQHPDMISNHWMYRWVAETVMAGDWTGLLHNDRYYLPIGDAPVLAGNGGDAVLYGLVARLFSPLASWPGGLTAWVLGVITLNGLAGLALARAAGARWAGSVVAGSVLVLSPYLAHELSGLRLAQVPAYPFAFFLAAWLRMGMADGRRQLVWAGAAGVLYALTALLYWYHGLWAALVGTALLLFGRPPRARSRFPWRALGVFLVVAVPPVLGVLSVFARHWSGVVGTAEVVFPHPLAVESSLPLTFPALVGDVERRELALSGVLVALAVFGAWGQRSRRAALWLVLAGAFVSLSWGPELRLPSGASTGIPGPFALLYGLHPALQRYWWPYRHVLVTTLALLPLAAHAIDSLASRVARSVATPRTQAALVAVTALCLGLLRVGELQARGARLWAPSSWWSAPPAYAELAGLPGAALFELPVTPALCTSQQTLSYQWVHQKDLVNGHAQWVDRVRPEGWDAWVQADPLLSGLAALEQGVAPARWTVSPQTVAELRALGVRHVVLNAEAFSGPLSPLVPAYREVLTALFGRPVVRAPGRLWAWDLATLTTPTTVAVPAVRLPEDLVAGDGSRRLELGGAAAGWREAARGLQRR